MPSLRAYGVSVKVGPTGREVESTTAVSMRRTKLNDDQKRIANGGRGIASPMSVFIVQLSSPKEHMKYTLSQLESMARTLIEARRDADPRWWQFLYAMAEKTGMTVGKIALRVEFLAKEKPGKQQQ